jgi:thioredoxin reductase (NADPH)
MGVSQVNSVHHYGIRCIPRRILECLLTLRVGLLIQFSRHALIGSNVASCQCRQLGLEEEERLIGAGSTVALVLARRRFVRAKKSSLSEEATLPGRQRCTRAVCVQGPDRYPRHRTEGHLIGFSVAKNASEPNVHVVTRIVIEALTGDATLREVKLKNVTTGDVCVVATRWPLICIGGEPQTSWAATAGIARDDAGYIFTGPDLEPDTYRNAWPLHW